MDNSSAENKTLIETAESLKQANEKLRAVFEGSHDAIMLLSEKGFFDCNNRTLEIFGVSSKAEFTSLHPAQLSPEKQADGSPSFEKANEQIGKAFREGYHKFEWLHKRMDGEVFSAEVLLSAFNFGAERVLQATVRELSKEKQLLSQITNQQTFYGAILNSVQEGYLVKDSSRKIISCNETAANLLGISQETLLREGTDSVLKNTVGENGFALGEDQLPSRRVLKTGIPERNVLVGVQQKSGALRWLNFSAIPFKAEFNGKSAAALVTFSDVTDEVEKRHKLSLSEKRLNEAQAVAKIGSWSFDLATKKIDWTPQLFELFPFPKYKEPSFEELKKVIHSDDLPAWELAVEQCIRQGVPYSIRHRVIHPEFTIWVEAIGVAFRDSSGAICGLHGTCQNVTEKVLLEEENHFITSSLKLGIWKFDPNNNKLDWDKGMYSVFGVNEKDFCGSYDAWEKTLTPDAKAKAIEDLGLALRGEKDFDTTFKIVTAAGEVRHIGGRGIVKRNAAGQPIMMYGVNWDKTKEMQLLESLDLEKAKSLQTAKLASLGEMSASIAHEINNPLAIISGHVAMLEGIKQNPEKFLAKVELIQRAIERISKIVNGLRKFSRTTEKKAYLPHSLEPIIREALILVEAKAKKNNVRINLNLQSEQSVFCDDIEIEQVLVNLINNSIDAVRNSPEAWIEIATVDEKNESVLRVTDSGSGIAPNVIARMFEPFYTTKAIGQGTGLGLSIVKGILDEHQASIRVLEDVKNTCFEVRFKKLVMSNVA